ncbi:MAG: hypothetical protein H7X75_01510 [Burkholderiaceae bacterium]|nr:hypothetical protein [Burkholderiaceae bacterium]
MPAPPDEAQLVERWNRIRAVRAEVHKKIEPLREQGAIGSSLQAEVEVVADAVTTEHLQSLGEDLRFVLITSRAQARAAEHTSSEQVVVNPSAHTKCERCWHWRADVGGDPSHPTICGRCVSNLFGTGEPRRFA